MCIAFFTGAQTVSLIEQQRTPVVASGALQANPGIVARLISTQNKVAAIAAPSSPTESAVDEMAFLINVFRQSQGVPPVKVNLLLNTVAQNYAQRMADQQFFGHYDPDDNCRRPFERAQSGGYTNWTQVSENIAAGQATAVEAMEALKASPSHLKTLVNPNLREVGLGFVIDLADTDDVRVIGTACPTVERRGGPYIYYWAQDFASREISPSVPMLPIIINNDAFDTETREVSLYIHGGANGQPQWANQMRFSQDGVNWTDYETWQPTRAFTITGNFGPHQVFVEIKHIDATTQAETTQISSDTIFLQDPNNPNIVANAFIFLPAMVR